MRRPAPRGYSGQLAGWLAVGPDLPAASAAPWAAELPDAVGSGELVGAAGSELARTPPGVTEEAGHGPPVVAPVVPPVVTGAGAVGVAGWSPGRAVWAARAARAVLATRAACASAWASPPPWRAGEFMPDGWKEAAGRAVAALEWPLGAGLAGVVTNWVTTGA